MWFAKDSSPEDFSADDSSPEDFSADNSSPEFSSPENSSPKYSSLQFFCSGGGTFFARGLFVWIIFRRIKLR
jgi:hypothetical protein